MPVDSTEERKAVCPLLGSTCPGADKCAPAMIAFSSGVASNPMCPIVALVGSVHFLAMSFSADEEEVSQEAPQPIRLLSREDAIENLGNPDITEDETQKKEQPE